MPLPALAATTFTLSLALSISTCTGGPKHAPGPPPPPGPTTGAVQPGKSGDLGPCPLFPPDSPWNQDISKAPVDPNSGRYMAAMNAGAKTLHPDFGSSYRYGIPWFAVTPSMPRLEMKFKYDEESDPGPYPFPPDAPVEGGADADGDRHVIGIDRAACKLYEGFNCWYEKPHWSCEAGALFDLRSSASRTLGWTSADAAGLPVFPGLVRREEVLRGEIKHALRFTVRKTQRAFVAPATHFASPHRDPSLPPLGIRVRLKADYDISRFSGAPRVILIALKKYGMFLADNGADWFISGESNSAWDDDELRVLKKVPASAFEVVKHGEIHREIKR